MKVLNALGEELEHQFMRDIGDRGCTCFISPPCGYCTHEGNPANLEYQDDAWMDVWDLDEAVAAAQAAVAKAIEECTSWHLLQMKLQRYESDTMRVAS